jgi:hypothetical protein
MRRSIGLFAVGAAALLAGGTASADIETFYKTDICPSFGGLKPPIASEVGQMEAVQDNAFLFGGLGSGGTGGHFCHLLSVPTVARLLLPGGGKQFDVGNSDVVMLPGDIADIGLPGEKWMCVVCQYEDKVSAHPALSTVGTALLMGGLVSAMLFELRRRRAGSA